MGYLTICDSCNRAVLRETGPKMERISGPRDVWSRVQGYRNRKQETLLGLYLSAQNQLLGGVKVLSVGTLNTTRTHPREILKPAITRGALGFVLVHNHPSGDLTPSTDDVEFTQAIKRAAEIMGLDLYDHLVIGKGGYASVKELGFL